MNRNVSPQNYKRFSGWLAAVLSLFFAVSPADSPGQIQVPRFEAGDCAVPVPQTEKNVRCGFLIVPENRAAKNGKTIRLPVAILKSEAAAPQPDPVLRTLGGPGASSLRMIGGRRFAPWLKNRDMIVFEQRGTRYAQPSLACPEVDEANIKSVKDQLDARATRQNELGAARRCYDRLTRQGVDLSAYNSRESAADIEALRRALKIEKINLYGVSYSARLMLNVVRDFPGSVRSVVLESLLPPEVNYDEEGVDGVVYTLDRLFAGCRREAECAAAYPNLENEFYESVARLNREPVIATFKNEKTGEASEIKLNGNDFATWIVDYFFSNEPEATVDAPMIVHQVFEGDYAIFKRYAAEKTSPAPYSHGMRYSVWCGEEMPFEKRARIDAQSLRYPRLKGYEVMSLPDICGVWKVRAANSRENLAVKSEIPTLFLAAEYDAYTPPAWSRAAAKNLKNSFLFEVPWAGHGPAFSVPCVRRMIADFLDDPRVAPPSGCIGETRQKYKFTVKK